MTYLAALILAVGPILGCGVINPHRKNSEGYYQAHYRSCGPQALEKAFLAYFEKKGIAYCVRAELISKRIQSKGMARKELLAFFDKNAIQITWPAPPAARRRAGRESAHSYMRSVGRISYGRSVVGAVTD